MRRLPLVSLLAATAAWAAVAPARAQSLLSANGLGVPTPALDARARALGGVSTGLFGLDLSLANPADAADVRFRGGMASLQPFSRHDEVGGESGTTSGARFPVLRLIYPTRRVVFSAGYGGFLDQTWGITSSGLETIGGDTATVTDVVKSAGGLAQARVAASYLLTPRIAIGAGFGFFTGSVDRTVSRTFPDSANANFIGFTTTTRWRYHAPLATVGVRADVGAALRVGGAVTWAGTLKADSAQGAAEPRTYEMPLQAEGGVSAILAPKLMATVGGHWASWSRTNFRQPTCEPAADCVPGSLSRDTWDYGVGLEYGGTQSGVRTFPFRLGYHRAQLPFYQGGDGLPSEKSFSAGAGMRVGGFVGSENSPAAQLDATVERGTRNGGPSAGPLSESFWRVTVSLAIFGR